MDGFEELIIGGNEVANEVVRIVIKKFNSSQDET